MALLKEEKNKIVKEFQNSNADTGSPEVANSSSHRKYKQTSISFSNS